MSPRRVERSIDVAIGLIVVSVAVALAGLTWRIAGDPGRGSRGIAPVTATAAPPLDITPILALAPFGRTAPVAASPTSLGLQLRAILLAEPRSASTALISAGGGPPQAVAIGQAIAGFSRGGCLTAIAGGAIVDTIALDHVLLRVGGRTELLGFPRREGSSMPIPAAGAAPAAVLPPPAGAPPSTAASPGIAVPPAMALPPASSAPSAFLDSLGLAITDGGYRIGANPSAAARIAGLLPGDLIEKVNGSVAGNVDKDGRALDAAIRSGEGRLEIMRSGRRMTLSFPAR